MRHLSTLFLALLMPGVAAAQAFPSKPIRIVAGATSGGGVDASARVVAAADITAN